MVTGRIGGVTGRAWCEGNTAQCQVSFFWFDSGDYRVISTDYESYSIVRQCYSYLWLFRWEVFWVITRDQVASQSTAATVNNILQTKAPAYDQAANLFYPR